MNSEEIKNYELNEAKIFGEPSTSDAQFLLAMRKKLSQRESVSLRGVFGNLRTWGLVSTACVLLITAIFTGSRVTRIDSTPNIGLSVILADLDKSESFDVSDLADDSLDISAFASYLELPDSVSQIINSDSDEDSPITDELLALSDDELQAVLDYIQKTNFLES